MKNEIRRRRSAPSRVAAWALTLVLVAAVTSCAGSAPGAMDGVDPTNPFVGAWELADWRTVADDGSVTFPYGEDAIGQIAYTPSGRMSAHLQRVPDPGSPGDDGQHFSYWGTYSIQEDDETVTHHVIGSRAPSWVGSDQVREFVFESDDRLTLSLDNDTGRATLTWLRVR